MEFLWSKFPGRTGRDRAANNDASPEKDLDRRQALYALSAVAGGALSALPQGAAAQDSSPLPPPKRALTGRDAAGKSVFKSFDVTSKVVTIDSNPAPAIVEALRSGAVTAQQAWCSKSGAVCAEILDAFKAGKR